MQPRQDTARGSSCLVRQQEFFFAEQFNLLAAFATKADILPPPCTHDVNDPIRRPSIVCNEILDLWRKLLVIDASDNAVALQFTQLLYQYFFRYTGNETAQRPRPLGA